MNRKFFFDTVRPMFPGGVLSPDQVEGMGFILDKFDEDGKFHLDEKAYMLATTFHETAAHMKPVRETLAPTDDEAIRILDKSFARGVMHWVTKPYWRKDSAGRSWLGRGYVQLTHKANYQAMTKILDVDLVADPTLAMTPDVAIRIMFEGMRRGVFTGHALHDYLDGVDEGAAEDYREFVNARKIINGTESADKIATAALTFKKALAG
jgi:hypothetical protein